MRVRLDTRDSRLLRTIRRWRDTGTQGVRDLSIWWLGRKSRIDPEESVVGRLENG